MSGVMIVSRTARRKPTAGLLAAHSAAYRRQSGTRAHSARPAPAAGPICSCRLPDAIGAVSRLGCAGDTNDRVRYGSRHSETGESGWVLLPFELRKAAK